MHVYRFVVLIVGAVLLSGCAALPPFTVSGDGPAPTVNDVVDHIQCEIRKSLTKIRSTEPFKDYTFFVHADLTLEVTDDQGLNPKLSFIDPLKVMGKNFTTSVGGQLTGEQHRNLTINFSLSFEPELDQKRASCPDEKTDESAFGLRGKLGIGDIMSTGIEHITKGQYPYSTLVTEKETDNGKREFDPSIAPGFGSTIDFTIIYGLGGGPTWTMTHYVGPGDSGFLDFKRTVKDTLTIGFTYAPSETQVKAEGQTQGSQVRSSAAKAARDNVSRSILQRIVPELRR